MSCSETLLIRETTSAPVWNQRLTILSGNELCQQTNPNCTVLYGAALIAAVFNWTFFDGIAFLLATNRGFRATILDIATHIKTFPDTSAIATIRCGNDLDNDSFNHTNVCSDPTFHLNRDAVTIPGTNQTAAQVYERMNKDCAIV